MAPPGEFLSEFLAPVLPGGSCKPLQVGAARGLQGGAEGIQLRVTLHSLR